VFREVGGEAKSQFKQMKNLFHKEAYAEIIDRLGLLNRASVGKWGIMTVSQMLAHCAEVLNVPLHDKKQPRLFIGRIVGWAFKKRLYDDIPFKRNLPTATNFRISNEREFVEEKTKLQKLVDEFFNKGPEGAGRHPHPMFGSFSTEQWGMSMYKHLDHHLRQFGV
jgi:hypothetical protein